VAQTDSLHLDWWTRIWLGCAALWSLGLVAAGFFVNAYSSTNGPGETLVQQNGDKVVLVLLIPLFLVMIVAFTLWNRRRAERTGVGILVWVVFGLLALLVLGGAFTIGPFMFPVAVFVVGAISCAKSQSL
jgi:cytochrome bd-type quinol oxidase subunit 2